MKAVHVVLVTLLLIWVAALAGSMAHVPLWVVLSGWVAFLAGGGQPGAARLMAACASAGLLFGAAGKALILTNWASAQDLYLLAGGMLLVAAGMIGQYLPLRTALTGYAVGVLIALGSAAAVRLEALCLLAFGVTAGILLGLAHGKSLDRLLSGSEVDAA
jgi:hypothetical protein